MIKTQSMHHTNKYSQHTSIIWPVRLGHWEFIYKLSSCGFVPRCSHLNISWSSQYVFEGILISRLCENLYWDLCDWECWGEVHRLKIFTISIVSLNSKIFSRLLDNRLLDHHENCDLFYYFQHSPRCFC